MAADFKSAQPYPARVPDGRIQFPLRIEALPFFLTLPLIEFEKTQCRSHTLARVGVEISFDLDGDPRIDLGAEVGLAHGHEHPGAPKSGKLASFAK